MRTIASWVLIAFGLGGAGLEARTPDALTAATPLSGVIDAGGVALVPLPVHAGEYLNVDFSIWEDREARISLLDTDRHLVYSSHVFADAGRVLSLPVVAARGGNYFIRVESSTVPAIYQLSLRTRRRAMPQDKSRYGIETALLASLDTLYQAGKSNVTLALERAREFAAWCAEGNGCGLQAGLICAEINESLGRFLDAQTCSRAAAAILDSDPDSERRLAFLAEAAVLELPGGNLPKAVSLVNQARALLGTQHNGFVKVLALNAFCAVSLSADRYAEAKPDCQSALDLARQNNYQIGMANAMAALSKLASGQDGNQAIELADGAATIFHRFKSYEGEAEALQLTLPILWRQGKPQVTMAKANSALAVCQAARDPHLCWEANYWLGIVYESSADFDKARAYFQEGLSATQSANDVLSELGIRLRLINVDHMQYQDDRAALHSYEELLERSEPLHAENIEAELSSRIGAIHTKLGDLDDAQKEYARALAIYHKNSITVNEQAILYRLGGIYQSQHDYRQALASYEEALTLARKINFRTGIALALSGTARTLRSQGSLDDALSYIKQSIEVLESERTDILSAELRMRFLADLQPFFDEEFDLLLQMHDRNPSAGFAEMAFSASEQFKARVLLDTVPTFAEGFRGGVPPELVARERELRQNVEKASSNQEFGTKALEVALAEYDRLSDEIGAATPPYQAAKSPHILTVDEARSHLDADSALVEFRIADRRSVAFVITPNNKLFVAPLPGVAALRPLVDSLAKAQASSGIIDEDRAYKKAARDFSNVVLGPIAEQIKGKRLFLVSDSVLQNISFAGLPEPSVTKTDQPLVVDHEIVNLPSASVASAIESQRKRMAAGEKNIIVFANPAFADSTDSADSNAFSYENNSLLKVFANGNIRDYSGFRASLASLQAEDLTKYGIVHFATHTDVDTKHPELSGIRLSSIRPDNEHQPGTLRLVDIYNLRLKSELVVLSTCESAVGQDFPGEGLATVARGFMYAGSRRAIGTLWKVGGYDPAKLMAHFYATLLNSRGFAAAAALREAQLFFLKQGESPRIWAAFVLFGDWTD
jgi:CHAT domain-containing protein/tetratricopeptide (TPR) repeat protein